MNWRLYTHFLFSLALKISCLWGTVNINIYRTFRCHPDHPNNNPLFSQSKSLSQNPFGSQKFSKKFKKKKVLKKYQLRKVILCAFINSPVSVIGFVYSFITKPTLYMNEIYYQILLENLEIKCSYHQQFIGK